MQGLRCSQQNHGGGGGGGGSVLFPLTSWRPQDLNILFPHSFSACKLWHCEGSERALHLVGGRVAKNLVICHIRECDCHMATLQPVQQKNRGSRKSEPWVKSCSALQSIQIPGNTSWYVSWVSVSKVGTCDPGYCAEPLSSSMRTSFVIGRVPSSCARGLPNARRQIDFLLKSKRPQVIFSLLLMLGDNAESRFVQELVMGRGGAVRVMVISQRFM